MPTVLRVGGYRLFFYANEGEEPAHIHVENAERIAKLWLDSMTFAHTYGFTTGQQREIIRIVDQNMEMIRKVWHEFHSG